jgi:hypothetical protein
MKAEHKKKKQELEARGYQLVVQESKLTRDYRTQTQAIQNELNEIAEKLRQLEDEVVKQSKE